MLKSAAAAVPVVRGVFTFTATSIQLKGGQTEVTVAEGGTSCFVETVNFGPYFT